MTTQNRLSVVVLLTALLLTARPWALGASSSSRAAPMKAPPDILLEWVVDDVKAGATLEGRSGSTAEVVYRVRNVGGTDAYAVSLRVYSSLGPLGQAVRLRPGPRAGAEIERRLEVPLARGMREICVEGRLQNLDSGDWKDPNPGNNRACRSVKVVEESGRSAYFAGGAS